MKWILCIGLWATLAGGALFAQDSQSGLWLSGNLQGSIEGCGTCPGSAGKIPSLASTVAWWRSENSAAMPWVDAGGFLVGPDTMASAGKAMVRALSAANVQAAHVTSADLWFGLPETLQALEGASFVPFSANLHGAENKQRLFDPFAILDCAGLTVGVLGISTAPKEPIQGLWVQDPIAGAEAALLEWEALYPASPILLCFHGSESELQSWPQSLSDRFARVIRTGPLASSLSDRASSGPSGENGKLHLRVASNRGELLHWPLQPESQPKTYRVPSGGEQDPAVLAAVEQETGWADLFRTEPSPADGDTTPAIAQNRAMRAKLLQEQRLPQWNGVPAPKGMEWLLVELELENQIARDLRKDLNYLEDVQIAFPETQILALGGDGSLSRPFALDAEGGRLPIEKILLQGQFDFAQHEFGFLIPVDGPCELRIYHEQFATMVLPIGDESVAGIVAPTAENTSASNGRLALALREISQRETDGMIEWTVDCLAQSKMAATTDALALEAGAAATDKVDLGQPVEYLMAWQMLALVDTEGRHYYTQPSPLEDRVPVLAPDAWTRLRLRFRLPKGPQPSALWAPFTGIRTPGRPEVEYPSEISLPLGPDAPAALKTEFELQGSPLFARGYAAQTTEGGLRLRLAMGNHGPDAGFSWPLKRFSITTDAGLQVKPRLAHANGVPSAEGVWLPSDARLHPIELEFDLPAECKRARLVFRGVDGNPGVDLDWSAGDVEFGVPSELADPVPPTAPEAPKVPEVQDPGEVLEVPNPIPPVVNAPVVNAPVVTKPGEAKGLAGVGLTAQQVNEAIDRGADFLWKYTKEELLRGNVQYFGVTNPNHLLIALALVHSGLHERDAEFAKELRLAIPRMESHAGNVYPASVLCMLIDALGEGEFAPLMERSAKALIESQDQEGTWSYSARWAEPESDLEAEDSFVTVFETQATNMERESPWPEKPHGGDNSVIQFALMGLRSAERQGIHIPDATWRMTEERLRIRQGSDGGWGYVTDRSSGSMTCAGIGALAIARWGQDQPLDLQEPATAAGLDWVTAEFSVAQNPKRTTYHYYYLYSLERIGRLLGTEFFGPHEWFPLGAKYLVKAQLEDGSWKDVNNITHGTSFALLFLSRATESLTEPVEAPTTGNLILETAVYPDPAVYWIVDASGSMRGKLEGKSKLDWAEAALLEMASNLPAQYKIGLRAYGHRLRANEDKADQDSELLLPLGPATPERLQSFREIVSELSPRGGTPMAFSLQQATRDIIQQKTGTIILLTDGGEEVRGGLDPVEIAGRLAKRKGWNLVIVGFDIGKERWTKQLLAMAEAAGGVYVPSDKGESLLPLLKAAVLPLPDTITLEDKDGGNPRTLTLPSKTELPPGEYRLRFEVGTGEFVIPVKLGAGGRTKIRLDPANFQGK